MSAVATFTLIPVSKVEALKQVAVPKKTLFGGVKDGFHDFMKQHGRTATEYPWSGYLLIPTLSFLSDQGIDLQKSEFDELAMFLTKARSTSTIVQTLAQRDSHLAKLQGAPFSEDVLRDFYNSFQESNEPEAGAYMAKSIQAVASGLAAIEPGMVLILQIG